MDQECQNYNWLAWQCAYQVNVTKDLTAQEATYVLGGEASMWGEGINQFNFGSFVWHTASAVAERLWSSQGTTNPDFALSRLQIQTCKLDQMGLNAGPVYPNYCPSDSL